MSAADREVVAELVDAAVRLRSAIRKAEAAGWGSILVQLRESLRNIEHAVREAS